MLLFIVNVGHEDIKIIKGHTLAYLTPAQCDNLSDAEENNQQSKIAHISAVTSETKAEMLPAIPVSSKMIFAGDHTPVSKYAKISIEKYQKRN